LVVFQSDNGGPGGKSHVQLDTNGRLRGTKGQIQEGGIRVPLIMRWPAQIHANSTLPAGADSAMVVDVTDLLPTFCELAGVPAPLGIDGVSIAPTLRGVGSQRPRDFIIHEAGNGQSIIRGKYKLVRSKRSGLQLYDLEADPAESNDLAAAHSDMVKELETLLLGERVAEPKGFANTYHRWMGSDGAHTSDPDNWSDYRYANKGITYLTDDGAPRLSWIAHMKNSGDTENTARADEDLEVLGLEIRGNTESKASQSLLLGPHVNLTGRNEIRLGPYSSLIVDGGTVSSLRWIDIQPGAALKGTGRLDATIYNDGQMVIAGDRSAGFAVAADYRQSAAATLDVSLNDAEQPPLRIGGCAVLAGSLKVRIGKGFRLSPGKSYTVLTANRLSGTFNHDRREIVVADDARFVLNYSESTVTLTAE
jgi:hypothetical protein